MTAGSDRERRRRVGPPADPTDETLTADSSGPRPQPTSAPSGPDDPTLATPSPGVAVDEKLPSERIGDYRLVRRLGMGGMGEVLEAVQEGALRRRVALKLLKPDLDSGQVVARFESERQVLAMMSHNNIARVFDAGTTEEGRPYFAMEYVDGEPITRFADERRLSTRERIELFVEVCEGVRHAHQKGIIHRDLKPGNVMVCEEEGKAVPKIIDFGIAKAMEQTLTDEKLQTQYGVFVGTPAYMSPEQTELSSLDIDTRSDVYSLGAMLYELLVGEHPLIRNQRRSSSFDELRRRIREDEVARPSTLISLRGKRSAEAATQRRTEPKALTRELRGDLDWIVMKALEKDRERRYDSAAELGADLRRHLRNEPVVAGPPSTLYRLGKFVRRHRLGVAAAAMILLAVALGSVVATAGVIRAIRAERVATREAEISRQATEFLVGLFEVPDPREGGGATVTAREILDEGAEQLRGALTDQPEVRATMMSTMGRAYLNLGLYDAARQSLEEALAIRKQVFGPDHPATADIERRLAEVLLNTGDYAGAEEKFRRALEVRRRAFGDEHPDVVESLTDLASIRFHLGDMKEAKELAEKSLELGAAFFDEDSLALGRNYQVIGNVSFASGDVVTAETAYAKALTSFRRARGEEHLEVGQLMTNLAMALALQGRAEEAEPISERAHAMLRTLLGEEHPFVAKSYMARSFILLAQGRVEEAEENIRRSLALHRQLFGDQHPSTAEALINMSRVLDTKGEFAEAEPLIESAVETYRRLLPPDHWIRCHAESVLGGTLAGLGRNTEAEPLLVHSYQTLSAQLGDSFLTQEARGRLVRLYQDWGRPQEADRYRRPGPPE